MEQFQVSKYNNTNTMLQSQKNTSSRTYRNHSNIQFDDNLAQTSQPQNNYRSQSQVGRLMTDLIEPSQNKASSTYHFNNKISQVQKDYQLHQAVYPRFQKTNTQYQQFFRKTQKFVKPYTDCTKYVDSLMKNRQLLRRGAFDLPTQPINSATFTRTTYSQSNNSQNKTQNTEFYRNNKTALLKHNYEKMENIIKRKPSSDQKNGFDKTMRQQISSYKTLLNQQRVNRKDQVNFKNSMNRILAAEMINYRLLNTGHTLRPSSNVARSESHHL